MFERLVKYVLALPEEELGRVPLENITLCAAWFNSYADEPERQEPYRELRKLLDRWVRDALPPPEDTAGARQQPLLRKLVHLVQKSELSELQRGELDVLYFAVGLARRANKAQFCQRVVELIEPRLDKIAQIRESQPPEPGLRSLEQHITLVFPEDLKSAPPRDIRVFAGLSTAFRGPVITAKGDTKIIGQVPEQTAVIVEEGTCYVEGPVLGHLTATDACEVMGNVSGMVVARRGDVRANHILSPATVISKEGSVYCHLTEDPKLIYACRDLHVADSMKSGRYMARNITVQDKVCDGEVHVSGVLKAKMLQNSESRILRIVLRRGISCKDYGESLDSEADLLLLSAMKLRQQLVNLERLLTITEREADEYAGNVLLFVLGEEDSSEAHEDVQKLRRRIAFLDRLLSGVQVLTLASEDRISLMSSGSRDFDDEVEDRNLLDDMRVELSLLLNEGSVNRELHDEREAILLLGRKLRRKDLTTVGIRGLLERLAEKQTRLQEDRDALEKAASAKETVIERAMGRAALLQRAKEEGTRSEMLGQLLAAARKRPRSDKVNKRANDRYVRFMKRTIENRLSHVTRYRRLVNDIERRIQGFRERLWDEFQVSLPFHVLEGWATEGVRVTGCFDPGVILLAWPHLLEEFSPKDPGVHITQPGMAQEATFVRTTAGVIEER